MRYLSSEAKCFAQEDALCIFTFSNFKFFAMRYTLCVILQTGGFQNGK